MTLTFKLNLDNASSLPNVNIHGGKSLRSKTSVQTHTGSVSHTQGRSIYWDQ